MRRSDMTIILMVMIVIAVAAFIKSAIGNGEAVLAVPLLTHWVGIRVAVPVETILAERLVKLRGTSTGFIATWRNSSSL